MNDEARKKIARFFVALTKWVASIAASVIAAYFVWHLTRGEPEHTPHTGSVLLRDLKLDVYQRLDADRSAISGEIVIENSLDHPLKGCELKFRFPSLSEQLATNRKSQHLDFWFNMQERQKEKLLDFRIIVMTGSDNSPPFEWLEVRAECTTAISRWQRFEQPRISMDLTRQ